MRLRVRVATANGRQHIPRGKALEKTLSGKKAIDQSLIPPLADGKIQNSLITVMTKLIPGSVYIFHS